MTKQEQPRSLDEGESILQSTRLTRVVERAADICVVLDADATVLSVTVNAEIPNVGRLEHWAGRNFRNFLNAESLPKFEARFGQALAEGDTMLRPLEVNHVDNGNWEFPIRYTLHDLGDSERYLLLGRDMQSHAEIHHRMVREQRAREREQQKQRALEAKTRMVLEASETAIVLVDPDSGRIVDVNTAAARLLGTSVEKLTDTAFVQVFEGRRRSEFFDALRSAASAESTVIMDAVARRSGLMLRLEPTYFRASGDVQLLCTLQSIENEGPTASALADGMLALFASTPDAMVLTDMHGTIQEANDSFLNLADATELRDAVGRPLSDFLARGSVDIKLLLDGLNEHGAVRNYSASISSAIGLQVPVEMSAVRLGQRSGEPRMGFIMRDASPVAALDNDAQDTPMSREAMQSVMDLVGTASLKDLVSATTDVIEKLCIETALRLTENNRVAAADMLGLSRQSLYAKLHKHGLREWSQPDSSGS